MFMENHLLYTDVMEWSFFDVVVRNMEYNAFEYLLCLLLITGVTVLISKTDKVKNIFF